MVCWEEKTFNGILCGECTNCIMLQSLDHNWSKFREDWYASHLIRQQRKDIWKEEMRYKVLGERYHNFITINLPIIKNPNNYYEIIKEWDIEWLKKGKGVFELHTKEGIHPHFHIVSYVKRKPNIISRDIERKFKIKNNFVDIKTNKKMYQIHIDYVNGVKMDNKLDFVKKDKEWRKENNIPNLINF